jgi:hypothetical protein
MLLTTQAMVSADSFEAELGRRYVTFQGPKNTYEPTLYYSTVVPMWLYDQN